MTWGAQLSFKTEKYVTNPHYGGANLKKHQPNKLKSHNANTENKSNILISL